MKKYLRQTKMDIFLPQEALSVIKECHVFIDTCFLLDFASLKKTKDKSKLIDLLNNFRNLSVSFITLSPVALEFYLGSTSQDLLIKEKYLTSIIDEVLPVRALKEEVTKKLIMQYGRYAKGKVSYVDLCLATALKQFPKTFLLTRNYKDFPLKIFGCEAYFILQFNNDLRTYCFYSGEKVIKKQKIKEEFPPF